jgi:predicted enzyme related to lactoylglutathione lyase
MHGTFAWNEFATDDIDAALRFYGETLGWTFERFDLPDGAYWVAKPGDSLVGGIGSLDTGADPAMCVSAWTAFIRVDEIDRRFARALELRASPVQVPHDVPNVGRVAVLRDPTGALIGWLQ